MTIKVEFEFELHIIIENLKKENPGPDIIYESESEDELNEVEIRLREIRSINITLISRHKRAMLRMVSNSTSIFQYLLNFFRIFFRKNIPEWSVKTSDQFEMYNAAPLNNYFWQIKRVEKYWSLDASKKGRHTGGTGQEFLMQKFLCRCFPILEASYWLIDWWNLSSNFYW